MTAPVGNVCCLTKRHSELRLLFGNRRMPVPKSRGNIQSCIIFRIRLVFVEPFHTSIGRGDISVKGNGDV